MKRFVTDIKKYYKYSKFAAKSDLKSEVASSYLNWLWWVLDPLLFMLVYTFIAVIVFRGSKQYFPVFVFIGLTMWDFFSKTVLGSVKMIRNNISVVTKVYLPKYVLILQRMMVNGFKMLISLLLVCIMMILYHIPVTGYIIYFLPIMAVLIILTFGISCIVLHFGVFIGDLYNVINILLRLTFYLSGIFYSIGDRVPDPYKSILLKCNPISMLIESARMSMIYSSPPYLGLLLFWGMVSSLLAVIGVRTIYKNENNYIKVMT